MIFKKLFFAIKSGYYVQSIGKNMIKHTNMYIYNFFIDRKNEKKQVNMFFFIIKNNAHDSYTLPQVGKVNFNSCK